ncbi:MAG TPA: hypothetical protein VFX70_15455 [Mycobacteriales bacterium]|nr:hypothetical protein [Mycobacteriales bacterium]
MSGGFGVSSDGLAAIAARLRESGRALDDRAAGAPDAPVAGESSGLVAGALAAVFRSAGSLSGGLLAAAEGVHRNDTGYTRADDRVAGDAAAVGEV